MSIKLQKGFLVVGIVSQVLFYISANFTGWLNFFSEHVTRGQDFFQVPNGAYALLHGGSLTGKMPKGQARYTDCCGVNDNVYHPISTLLVGIPLQFFKPWTAFGVWTLVHALATLLVVAIIFRTFEKSGWKYLAGGLYLVSFFNYYEIQHAHFHFLFVLFTLLFLLSLIKRGDGWTSGWWLGLSMLVKPIGIIWILPLLIDGKWKTVLGGLILYLAVTGPLWFFPWANYYFDNLQEVKNLWPSYNLAAISRIIEIRLETLVWLRNIIAGLLLVWQVGKRPPVLVTVVLWTGWQLIFYSGVYHYYYTIWAVLIPLLILKGYLKLGLIDWTIIVGLFTQPSILISRWLGAGSILSVKDYSWAALVSVAAVICLMVKLLTTYQSEVEDRVTKIQVAA